MAELNYPNRVWVMWQIPFHQILKVLLSLGEDSFHRIVSSSELISEKYPEKDFNRAMFGLIDEQRVSRQIIYKLLILKFSSPPKRHLCGKYNDSNSFLWLAILLGE